MIQANETFVNSYYYFSGKDEFGNDYENKIGRLRLNDYYQIYVEFNDISNEMLEFFLKENVNPIPLTPELLVNNCSFVNKGGWVGKSFETEIYDETVELIFEFMDGVLSVHAYDQRVRKIDSPSLHQLQNLYWCLCGKELIIDL